MSKIKHIGGGFFSLKNDRPLPRTHGEINKEALNERYLFAQFFNMRAQSRLFVGSVVFVDKTAIDAFIDY
jgi:hypothetical protein